MKDHIKDAMHAVKDTVDHAVADVRDGIHEAGHRAEADGEQAKREVAGDTLTPGEQGASLLNEGANRAQAEVDHAKRYVRDKVD